MANPSSSSSSSSSAPGSQNQTPSFTVTLGGTQYTQQQPDGLETFAIEDHVDVIGMAEFRFSAASGKKQWKDHKIGDEVEAKIGGSATPIFKGYITEVRGTTGKGNNRTFTVVAMDPLCKLAASRTTKVYEEVTDSDIVSTVISEGGVTAGTVDSTTGTSKYVIQRNESDLFFLKRLAARNGFQLTAREGKIDFKKVQFSDQPTKVAHGELIFLEWAWSTAQVPKDVTVYGWDYIKKTRVQGTSAASDLEKIGSGPDAVAETGLIWQKNATVSDVLVSSDEGAKAMATSEINRMARSALRGRAVVQGNGALRAGTRVKFDGKGDDLCPEGYVIGSRHTVDEGGFLTEIHFVGNTKPVSGSS